MSTRHAREIRKGLLVARDWVRSRREHDFQLSIQTAWNVKDLTGLSEAAFDRSWMKEWRRFK